VVDESGDDARKEAEGKEGIDAGIYIYDYATHSHPVALPLDTKS
jgi:hypothetical protein